MSENGWLMRRKNFSIVTLSLSLGYRSTFALLFFVSLAIFQQPGNINHFSVLSLPIAKCVNGKNVNVALSISHHHLIYNRFFTLFSILLFLEGNSPGNVCLFLLYNNSLQNDQTWASDSITIREHEANKRRTSCAWRRRKMSKKA
jgi:hypothetical protein